MSHYYSEEPTAKLRLYRIKSVLRGFELEFITSSGVFSPRSIDKGTRVLIENMIVMRNWRVLDLGCGYGPIGIVAAKLAPEGFVVMTDINKRAVWLAKMNARINHVDDRVSVRQGNLYEPVRGEVFDTIISNPPQVAGMSVCFRLIDEAPDFLKPGGLLQLVFRRSKGGSRIAQRMKEVFGNCKVIAKSGGYWVYLSTR